MIKSVIKILKREKGMSKKENRREKKMDKKVEIKILSENFIYNHALIS